MTRILVINQYYPPDSAATGRMVAAVCEALVAHGASVLALVGQPSYSSSPEDAPFHESDGRLTVIRLPMGRFRGRRSLAVRVLGYTRFLYSVWIESGKHERPHVIVTFHNPPLLGTLGALLARRYRVPFAYVVQDIHPDILERLGWTGVPRRLFALWRRANQMALESARLTITLSEDMKDYLVSAYEVDVTRVVAIPVWAQPEFDQLASDEGAKIQARRELDLLAKAEELVVLCAGNMGYMHPLETVIAAAAAVRGQPIRFLLVGDGVRRRHLEELVRESSLEKVDFLPYQSERDFQLLLQAADLCVVALAEGLENLCVPSRAMTFMSAGRPLLAVMSPRAPLSRELALANAGWNASTADRLVEVLDDLVRNPQHLLRAGAAARALYVERYRMDMSLRRYAEAILDLT